MNIKHLMSTAALSLLTSISYGQSAIQQRCHTDEYHQLQVVKYPELAQAKQDYKALIQQKLAENQYSKQSSAQGTTIPVVFHVVYRTNAQNIPDARIFEQIQILNDDFSANNTDINTVPSDFEDVIGNSQIQFVLASVDPAGNATSGITRTNTSEFNFDLSEDNIKYDQEGGKTAWDTDLYLNIWVGNIEDGILGYATPPSNAGSDDDGVVIAYRHVGNSTNGAPYNLGRTATHEVGHYFGLDHPWGPGFGGCSEDDGISDTPLQAGENSGDPNHPIVSCGTADMFMNYMDYCNDASLVMFTEEQNEVMDAVLSTVRNSLTTSPALGSNEIEAGNLFTVYPNPAKNEIKIQVSDNQENAILSIADVSGKIQLSTTLNSGNQSVDVSTLTKGLYLFELKTATETRTQKVILTN
ncbi:MAG: T9SS type A sorting domain-containing protein [Flavobacteriales bacterium]